MKISSDNIFIYDRPVEVTPKYLVQRALYPFVNGFYRLLYAFFPHDRRTCSYELTVCAIFKNEAPFLREWIEFHAMLGVGHFYLYNNNSTDNYLEVLEPYLASGLVTLIDWPEIPGQLSAYKHWYDQYRHETKWVTFIDIDEFICLREAPGIPQWLAAYDRYPVLVMYWRFFGTSGRLTHDPARLVIEQYDTCFDRLVDIGKIFFNTRYRIDPFKMAMWHCTEARPARGRFRKFRLLPVNDDRNIVVWNLNRKRRFCAREGAGSIQLNHYWSKAFSTYCEKRDKGASAFKESYITDDLLFRNELRNRAIDRQIFRFLLRLKLKMED